MPAPKKNERLRAWFGNWRTTAAQRLIQPVGAAASTPLLILSACVSVLLVAWQLWSCRFGLDFSDECFYLISITNPWLAGERISVFGDVYHPLYTLLNQDVVALRRTVMLTHFVLSWALCWEFLGLFVGKGSQTNSANGGNRILRAAISLALAMAGLMTSLPMGTPSYNDLNKTAFLLSGLGILLANATFSLGSVAGWLLIGVAGYLSFLAKPPSAALMGVVLLAYLLVTRKFNWKLQLMAIIACLALLAGTEVAINGSLSATIANMRNSLAEVASYGATGNLFRFNSPARLFRPKLHGIATNAFLIVAAAAFVWALATDKRRRLLLSAILLACAALVFDSFNTGLLARFLKWVWNLKFDPLAIIAWQAFFLGVAGLLIVFGKRAVTSLRREHWALLGCLLALPYAYAFGTGNNYLTYTGFLAIFVILALVLLVSRNSSPGAFGRLLLPMAAMAQLLAVANAAMGMEFPFRQPPYREMRTEISLPDSSAKLFVTNETAEYIKAIRSLASQRGFARGTPVINLTGYDLGTLYFLEGRSLGAVWIFGNISTVGTAYAEQVLSRVPASDLQQAWVLTAPGTDFEIPTSFLPKFLPGWGNYELVADLPYPLPLVENERRYLYKPRDGDGGALHKN